MTVAQAPAAPVLDLGPEPESVRTWLSAIVRHREVAVALAAKDFKIRYKRATFGVLWAVALPLLQSLVMVTVFSRVAKVQTTGFDYLGHVLSGMAAWSFAAVSISTAATAIVDGSSLTDKVWFPRALLVLAPIGANLIGLGISLTIIGMIQAVRSGLGINTLVILPAVALLAGLVTGISLTAAALHVKLRDVRFLVQAGLLLLFYATPVIYPFHLLGGLGDVLQLVNPFVGVVQLFQHALAGEAVSSGAVFATSAWTIGLLTAGTMLHHRNDRLFVDLL